MTELAAVPVPAEVVAALDGTPTVGELDQAFLFLTADPTGLVDVCLLSRTEIEPGHDHVRLVVASTRARRNLQASHRATLVAVCGDAAHYLGLEVRRTVEGDEVGEVAVGAGAGAVGVGAGAVGVELTVVRSLRDDVGVELRPLQFRAGEQLRVTEHWDRTATLLARLGGREPVP
ncbi:MAG: hypothetical protein ACRDY3_03250 [Acidimicrobiales bacterium]